MLLNNLENTEEIKEEIKQYLETNDNENTLMVTKGESWGGYKLGDWDIYTLLNIK